MLQYVYSVFDAKADAFMQPFFTHTDGLAIRSFSDALASPDSNLSRHREDYSLFKLGEFDDSRGVLESLDSPQRLIMASDV